MKMKKLFSVLGIIILLLAPADGWAADTFSVQKLMGAKEQVLRKQINQLEEANSLSGPRRNKLLGVAYHNLCARGIKGKAPEAVKHLQKARKKLDSDPVLVAFLGSSWTLRGRDAQSPTDKVGYTNKGIKIIDRAVQMAPKNILVRILRMNNSIGLPSFFGRSGKVEEDINYLLSLYKEEPDKFSRSQLVTIYKTAGNYYKKQEDYSSAIAYWEKVAERARGEMAETAENELAKLKQLKNGGEGAWGYKLAIYLVVGFVLVVLLTCLYFFVYIPYFEEDSEREMGRYRFEVIKSEEEKNIFYDFLKKEFVPESVPDKPEEREDFIEGIKEDDAVYEDTITRIMGYHGGKPVCALLLVEPNEEGLMYDYQDKFDFSTLKKRGKIIEVGRLCIDSEYRHKPSLLQGILCWVVELAMKKRGLYLLVSALRQDQPLYQKLGFEIMEGCTQVDEKFGKEKVMVLNIPRFLEEERYSESMEASVRLSVSVPYILRFIAWRSIFQEKTVAEMDVTKLGKVQDNTD